MKYFSHFAEQSFQTSPNGERLFIGFWPKKYIIPNEETEKRLFKKELWMWRIFFGTLIFSQPILFMAIPNIVHMSLWSAIYILAILVLFFLVNWLVFRKEIQQLKQSSARIPFLSYYDDLAKQSSTLGIFLNLLGSIGFIWAGSWMVREQFNMFIGWLVIALSILSIIVWVYTFYLKSAR